MKITVIILQAVLLIAASPFISGFIKKLKNHIRMRKGAPLLQPYHNIVKLFGKDETISKDSSYIFRIAPYVLITTAVAAALLSPSFFPSFQISGTGDIFVIIFIFALGRFFTALAGLDTGSTFGGMGSSREMFISALAEPAFLVSVFAASLAAGNTGISSLLPGGVFKISLVCSGLAFYLVLLAETARVPVDNQETHLELTMIHEAMILEYSGKSLALIELAGHIKQLVLLSLLVYIFIPVGSGTGFYIIKIVAVAAVTAIIEVALAKMRLFRVVDYLIFSFVLSLAAVTAFIMGV